MRDSKELSIEFKDRVAFITIDNPEKGNSLSTYMIEGLIEFFLRTARSQKLRVTVLTGIGKKYFCSGADVGEFIDMSSTEQKESFRRLAELYEAVIRSPTISITRVNGLALGAGFGLVAASDIAFAEPSALFGIPEVKLGVAPLVALLPLLRSLGEKKAFFLAASGHIISAQKAYELGLIDSIATYDTLDRKVEQTIIELVERSGTTVELIKKGVQKVVGFSYLSYYDSLEKLVELNVSTDDFKEGISAFLEKRRPVWKNTVDFSD